MWCLLTLVTGVLIGLRCNGIRKDKHKTCSIVDVVYLVLGGRGVT